MSAERFAQLKARMAENPELGSYEGGDPSVLGVLAFIAVVALIVWLVLELRER